MSHESFYHRVGGLTVLPRVSMVAYLVYLAPSKPRDVSVVSLSATSLSVRWIEPERPNGIIRYYTVMLWPGIRL